MKVSATTSSLQGHREYQEDRVAWFPRLTRNFALAVVFDGHVGDAAAIFAVDNVAHIVRSHLMSGKSEVSALEKTIEDLEYQYNGQGYSKISPEYQRIMKKLPTTAGTTAVIALFDLGCNKVYIANVGDSRAVLIRDDFVFQLTMDHSIETLTTDEKRKILATGVAKFKDDYVWTELKESDDDSSYGLNVLRTLGDPLFKKRFHPSLINKLGSNDIVSWKPDIYKYELKDGDLVVLATDGVYNFINNSLVGKFALKSANSLTHAAFKHGSTDNISAVVVSVNV